MAKKLGCTIEVHKPRSGKLITIWLPSGMQVSGNPGLNFRVINVENDDDIWPYVFDDLKDLDGGMEPLDADYLPGGSQYSEGE